MNKKTLAKCLAVIFAVIMAGCSSSNTPAETTADTASAEATTVSETSAETTTEQTSAETTTEETTPEETTAEEETAISDEDEDTDEPKELGADFSKYFATDLDISDYDKRFCGFKFDDSIIINSEDDFYNQGGTADMCCPTRKPQKNDTQNAKNPRNFAFCVSEKLRFKKKISLLKKLSNRLIFV